MPDADTISVPVAGTDGAPELPTPGSHRPRVPTAPEPTAPELTTPSSPTAELPTAELPTAELPTAGSLPPLPHSEAPHRQVQHPRGHQGHALTVMSSVKARLPRTSRLMAANT